MKPYLPQDDPEPQKRQDLLERSLKNYEFDLTYLPPLPMLKVKQVPRGENFSAEYLAKVGLAGAKLISNTLEVKFRSLWDPLDQLQDYEDFFQVLPKPEVIRTYQSDNSFGEQRLSGANPMVLRKIQALSPHFQAAIQDIQNKFGLSLNLEERLANGHMYVADYTHLSFIQGGAYERGKTYLPSPIALFCWQSSGFSDRGQLVPVAIQIDPQLDESRPVEKRRIVTPFDESLTWFHAKLCVQVADANHHEMSSHLCRTHFVMEPFAIATGQHLAESHPLSLLLRPHFRFTLAINDAARTILIQPGGSVDELLAGTLKESLEIVKDAFKSWSLDQFALPTEVKNRGMDDRESLPHYPYRDDGILLWNTIHRFVSSYLKLYYKNTEALKEDQELQNWAQKLFSVFSSDGGNGKGVPEHIQIMEQLVEIVTAIIFTCGPQHSAVNFSQYEYMAFVPNMPFAAYRLITEELSSPEQNSLMPFLPPPKQAAGQLALTYLLSSFRYDKLGYYEEPFEDLQAQELVKIFQQELNEAEREIELRNVSRLVQYKYLKPSLVLNSISI